MGGSQIGWQRMDGHKRLVSQLWFRLGVLSGAASSQRNNALTRKSNQNYHIYCSQVTLGKTRVLAQVSATVTEPRLSRLPFLDCGVTILTFLT